MKILVTGGAGFIGSHVVHWLVAENHQVSVLDNFSTGRYDWLAPVHRAIDLITGDIRDFAMVLDVVQHADLIIHLAAMVSVVQSVEHPLDAYAVNTIGSLHVLEAACQAGVRRVVQASSCAVYGNTKRLPVDESSALDPLSPYAATKLAAEQACQLYTRTHGIEAVALRFFNVYSPRQDPASPYAAVVPRFIAALQDGQQPTIYGDGQQSRDFVYVGDIVQALWVAGTTPGLAGKVFNVGHGEACSIRHLSELIGDLLGVSVMPHMAADRNGEVQHSCADVTLFEQRAGFRAHVSLRDGLQATIRELSPQLEGKP